MVEMVGWRGNGWLEERGENSGLGFLVDSSKTKWLYGQKISLN